MRIPRWPSRRWPRRTSTEARGCTIRRVPDLERLRLRVEPAPPFRLDLTAAALRRRASNAIDRWDGETWRRVLIIGDQPLGVEVVQIAPPERPILQVTVRGACLPAGTEAAVRSALARLLGVDRNLDDFYRAAAADPRLDALAQLFRGLKPPRFATLFEALVNAFACQQVTLSLGIQLLNRLAQSWGRAWDGPDGRAYAFPVPDDLAERTPEELRALGFSRQKGTAIIELARAGACRSLDLGGLAALDDAAAVARLRTLRGVGRWTAEYALLRGLGRLHVFPGDDIGARNNLQRWLGLLEPLDYDGVRRVVARWHPFQGLVYLHLLLWSLQRGRVPGAGHPGKSGEPSHNQTQGREY
jgi:DNA-3-methyladenine glycosylase II